LAVDVDLETGWKYFGIIERLETALGKTVDLVKLPISDKEPEWLKNAVLQEGLLIYEKG